VSTYFLVAPIVGLIVIGNYFEWKAWENQVDLTRGPGRWDLWFHPERFTPQGQMCRRLGARCYLCAAALFGAVLVISHWVP
jgi:hypothetical protein